MVVIKLDINKELKSIIMSMAYRSDSRERTIERLWRLDREVKENWRIYHDIW